MSPARRLLFLSAAFALPWTAMAADAAPLFTLHEAGPGVWAATATPGSPAGSNAGFVIGDDGVLVVDSFEDPAAASALLAVIRTKTALPVRYLVNTHYHLDHVAGNGVFRAAGATLLAQRNVRAWERTDNLKFFGDQATPAQRAMVAAYVLPEVVYRDGIEIYLGQRRVDVSVLPGHTGGDSVVSVPDAHVVFTGDLFWGRSLPNLIDANTAAQIDSTGRLVRAHPDATFVPGHGPLGGAADVSAFRGYLVALRAAIAAEEAQGASGAALESRVRARLEPAYGGWNYYGHFVARNITQTVDELAGRKVLPEPLP